MTTTQTPPADELAALRARMKADKAREGVLRQLMLSDPSARTGNTHIVEIVVVQKSRTDWDEIRELHPALIDEHTYPISETRVETRNLDPETGEITRRPPKLHTIRVV